MRYGSKSAAVMPAERNSVWRERIAQWERSGRTQRAFCKERRLALSTFQWWRARLRQAVPAVTQPFVPIALGAAEAQAVEVTLRSNTRVRVEGAAVTRLVDAVIARLR